ncbi:MAG: CZB domain-containing protein [Verrucomicrobia bacterium]|nr:CZB domain-containing protein [Verrucomicrobiota bacterium]
MNVGEAIAAHGQWKVRLRGAISGQGDRLDAATVRQENQCELGQWILGEGQRYNTLPVFTELRQAHAEFHRAAADIIEAVNQGDRATAERLLDDIAGTYRANSRRILVALQKLQPVVSGP